MKILKINYGTFPFEKNNIKPSVDEIFELSEVNDALKKVDKGGSKGKTLIKI